MKNIFKKLCCIFVLLLPFSVTAETIKIVVPWSAGGIADKTARLVQQSLLKQLPPGTTVVVENHPSANGIIGTRLVASNKKKETVLLLTTSLGILYQLQQAEAAALEQNLIPVACLGSVQQALVASKKSNLTTISDIQNINRAIFYGSSIGIGSANYLAGQILFDQLKKEMVQIPFKGEADALNAVLADTVDLVFITARTALQYRDRLAILGVTGKSIDNIQSLSKLQLQNFDQSLLQLVLFANSTADPQTIKQIQNALYKTYFSNEKDNYISAGLDIDPTALLTADSFFVAQVPKLKSILVNLKIDQVDTKDK
jgi:hypothetical protein